MYRYRENHVAIRPCPSALLSVLSSTRKIRINAIIHKSFSKYHSCKKHFNYICIKFSFSNWMRNSLSESLIPLCHWLKKYNDVIYIAWSEESCGWRWGDQILEIGIWLSLFVLLEPDLKRSHVEWFRWCICFMIWRQV